HLDDAHRIKRRADPLAFQDALKTMGSTLRKELRDTDLIVSYGVDEFLILSPGVSRDQAEALKSRLQDILDRYQYSLASESVFLPVSIGTSLFPEDGGTLNALLSSAESAARADRDLRAAVRRRIRPVVRD